MLSHFRFPKHVRCMFCFHLRALRGQSICVKTVHGWWWLEAMGGRRNVQKLGTQPPKHCKSAAGESRCVSAPIPGVLRSTAGPQGRALRLVLCALALNTWCHRTARLAEALSWGSRLTPKAPGRGASGAAKFQAPRCLWRLGAASQVRPLAPRCRGKRVRPEVSAASRSQNKD